MAHEEVWYFAFGANMSREVFVDRREMAPTEGCPARLDDHRLTFDMPGIPLVEPAFASIAPEPGQSVWGVAWRISAEAAARLHAIEDAPYAPVDITVDAGDRGMLRAFAYRNTAPVNGLRPSRRYRDLLAKGAREWDLPSAWCRELAEHPASHVPILSSVATRYIGVLETLHRWNLLPWEWFR